MGDRAESVLDVAGVADMLTPLASAEQVVNGEVGIIAGMFTLQRALDVQAVEFTQ